MKNINLMLLCLSVFGCTLRAETIDFSGSKWDVEAQEARIETFKGQTCLFLNRGGAVLPEANFTNGVIEYDIAISKERGFHGVHWRLQDNGNYEEFYVRPHQSGNPDACQYTPVYNGISGWQLYYGEGYGAAINYKFDQWMHVKVVVNGKHGEVYVEDMSKPALVIHEMKREIKAGGLGLSSGFVPVRYANFTYRADNNVKLQGEIKEMPGAPAGAIMSWQVSDAFDGERVMNEVSLPANIKNLHWHTLQGEKSGLANLAQIQGISEKSNTVYVKTNLGAAKAETKQLSLGYSDIAFVYLNGQLLYSGQRIFQSRDYRYLGTIGYFDSVFLPLKAGDNELVIAVAENFGGWGIQAKLENAEDVTMK